MALFNVILLKFNNYLNKKVKFYNDLSSYPLTYDSYVETGVNFKFADGIRTNLIVGKQNNPLKKCDYDYLLLINEDRTINSRWFIIEADYKLTGQFNLSLKRDTVADFFDSVKESKALIRKATIKNPNNPLIFNREGIEFNQIKKKEILLKDETNSNWLIGYLAKDYQGTGDEFITSIDFDDVSPDLTDYDIKLNDDSNPSLGGYIDVFKSPDFDLNPMNITYNVSFFHRGIGFLPETYKCRMATNISGDILGYDGEIITPALSRNMITTNTDIAIAIPEYCYQVNKALENRIRSPLINFVQNVLGHDFLTLQEAAKLKELNGKLVKYNNRYYNLEIISENYENYNRIFSGLEEELPLFSIMQEAARDLKTKFDNDSNFSDTVFYEDDYPAYAVEGKFTRIRFSLVETTGPSLRKIKIPSLRQTLIDAPYNMFAIKFSVQNMALVTAMIEELGTNLYDVQLLPYFPRRELIGVDLSNIQEKDATPIYLNEEIIDYCYWCVNSSDTFSIVVNDDIFKQEKTALDIKVKNETELCRICSPNYNGVYEFSIAKNNGVSSFIASFTYKPYTPFILVSPNFGGLYGTNFNDGRGLICNGDFSLAIINDQWKSYEINNKNYQNIFDTQIKTNDANNAIDITNQSINAALGAAGTGIAAGMFLGPAGGVASGIMSAIGGAADIALGQAKYQNQRQATIDIYNYNLGNIKARPDTLTKISSYNINNKYFPFIEYYTCTDEEKEIFRSKLEWDGMTVMKIDKISNWLDSKFIKADIIRVEELNEDSHIAYDIATELSKGVYLE